MTDEEFLELKKHIKEVGSMCREINMTFSGLKIYFSELDKSITRFERDIDTLKSGVNALEEI